MTMMETAYLASQTDGDSFHSKNTALDAVLRETLFYDVNFLCKPAFTEAAFVSSPSDAFNTTLTRLYEGAMDLDPGHDLRRSLSLRSHSSNRSQRSQTGRAKPRKFASYASSIASSTATSDKSLTSFPSLSPESPTDERSLGALTVDGAAESSRRSSGRVPSIVDSLTTFSPQNSRDALFDDASVPISYVPGAIHLASDEHVKRLLARHGAVTLVKQIAEDLAQRDAQIAALRRKTEERERALRKIILECGLSNLDLETRLRSIEEKLKMSDGSSTGADDGPGRLEELINDAISDSLSVGDVTGDITIRASGQPKAGDPSKDSKNSTKGWKDYIWGGGTSKRTGGPVSSGDDATSQNVANRQGGLRPTVLQTDLFAPPDTASVRISSRTTSSLSSNRRQDRKSSTSLATLALRLVAGNSNTNRDGGLPNGRERASSAREMSMERPNPSVSIKASELTPRDVPSMRRKTVAASTAAATTGRAPEERWDTMVASPQNNTLSRHENYGPVEMDTILPPEAQPPTLSQAYNNRHNSEFLTDRFGFIYDQRRKKRQKEAADSVQKIKRNSRVEMLSSSRSGLSPSSIDDDLSRDVDSSDGRPDTPISMDDRGEESKPAKRWQDYLKIATFPTELLSHTPSAGAPTMEVLEADSGASSPGITAEERGFVPPSSTAGAAPTISGPAEHATLSKPAAASATTELAKEDVEPVKLLLEQLSDVHDSLQREKAVRWNDFLRKVRAERKREGEAAAAALAASSETRSQRAMTVMPEVSLADGEMIGVAGLGVKGKVGRAKWNEFKSLVLAGIPVAYRAKIWAECSGATALRVPGYYDELVARHTGEDDPVVVSQIQMDINRTLTDNIFFRRGAGVAKLNEVLLAYSRRNKEVGYCQGMNLITACLLLIMPTAEDAFWILTSIVENILPRGYYDHSLLASRADQQVLRQYVSSILPKLSSHLDNLGIELEALTFQWFLSLFTDCLSAEALFRVWDVVLCTNDGSTFLFQVALALLKLNELQLLQCDTPAGIYTYINHQMTNHAISIDGLIHASEGLRKTVKREDVEALRAKAIETEHAMIRQREAKDVMRKAKNQVAIDADRVESEAHHADLDTNGSDQLKLGVDDEGELTLRTPRPVDEEAALNWGLD
ncbi:MAG: hypothetical protein M1818_001814 [Claussenomyces sp. TS43310]|nr:MAG: hypothetical protein M1818_001814 [Claussenomyces sp. TS43310]